MATISYDDGSGWTEFDYSDFTINQGNGKNKLAPEATIWTHKDVSVSTDDLIKIVISGSIRFEGYANSSGTIGLRGEKEIPCRGYGYDIMEEEISLNLSSVSPEDVLSNAISGTNFTLNTSTATGITIGTYDVTDRKRKNIFW